MKKHIFAVLACLFVTVSAMGQKLLYQPYAVDTITNTESDTIYVNSAGASGGYGTQATAVDFQNIWAGKWLVTRTQLSGTTNVALKVESTPIGGTSTTTAWAQEVAGAGTGATAEWISISEMLGRRYRIILTGSGTQSSLYFVYFSGKKKT